LPNCKKKSSISINNNEQKISYFIKDVELKFDLSDYKDYQKKMIYKFIKIAHYIDTIFYYENYKNYNIILDTLRDSLLIKKYRLNYGPWERFNNNKPFIAGVGQRPLGLNFYPENITRLEFYEFSDTCKYNPYTFIRRNKNGKLYCVPYHIELKKYVKKISQLLKESAKYAKNIQFAKYLKQRANDILVDNYSKSDSIWLQLKHNTIDFIVGPIYVSEDRFMNIKAEHQAVILIKDTIWTKKLQKYQKWLKFLQKAIPVEAKYRAEDPKINSTIVVANAVYFGGSASTSAPLISEIFPVITYHKHLDGVKNLQFENIINYKFNEILKPISNLILVDYQNRLVSQNAFFENNFLYEMANGLGIRNTINNKGSVHRALKNYYTISNYIKNYTLSLFLADKLFEIGEIKTDLKENYYTFVVNLVRLIRFGNLNDYAIANLVIFNYLSDNEAIIFDNKKLKINFTAMREVIKKLTSKIITMQGDGNYEAMKTFVNKYDKISSNLEQIIELINTKKTPTDINLVEGSKYLKLP
jgi:hypothetical protein